MVETALRLGKHHGVELQGIVSGAENLNLPGNAYDIIYVANTIHHIQNRALLFEQMSRALKPGGMFFSYDPLAYNPVINLYRKMATGVRTSDESPLTTEDIGLAGKYFQRVQHREFWIATLFLFAKYYAIDGIHPNTDRYWKRILSEKSERLGWWQPLKYFDYLLTRLPIVRWLAWNVVMWGQKAAHSDEPRGVDRRAATSPNQTSRASSVSTNGNACGSDCTLLCGEDSCDRSTPSRKNELEEL
jgi:SAM-dependent methyltransferase